MAMPSIMQKDFARVPTMGIPRSVFNRSKGHKTTFNAGYLVPIYCEEIYPADTLNFNMSAFMRLATPLHPFMDNLFFDWMAFFVPNRLVWTHWENFNGQQDDPDSSIDYLVPANAANAGYAENSLQDYFGLPTGIAMPLNAHTVLPLRGYNLIWNTWMRDQNLQDSITVDKGDGPDNQASYVLRRRGKRHDYFTSALPFAQKGTEVSIPLGTSAPVTGIVIPTGGAGAALSGTTWYDTVNTIAPNAAPIWQSGAGQPGVIAEAVGAVGVANRPQVFADLTEAADVTINALRVSIAMQQYLELNARGGTRYTEFVRSHFGVVSPDARLQRPEFLGAGGSYINITPISQQSASTEDSPQGNLAAIGTGSIKRDGFSKSFTEHGFVFVLGSVRADLSYQQGLDRMWSRRSREEFYVPIFANLGEQAVLNKEIYFQGTATDDEVFGYQERWAEMRYGRSMITGLFRSQAATSLDTWHLAQEFSGLPILGDTFIQDNPPIERVIAVPSEPHLIADFFFDIKHARAMPVFSIPGLLRL